MNIAVYENGKIIKSVIILDSVPEDTDSEFFVECPPWCWIGDSIDKPKPDDWIDTSESDVTESTLEQRISDLEDVLQTMMFGE